MNTLLRPEDVERIRAKYAVVKRPTINADRIRIAEASKEFRALRGAVATPTLFRGNAMFGDGLPPGCQFTLAIEGTRTIQRKQWVRLAWLEKYSRFGIRLWTVEDGRYHTVKSYILARNTAAEAEQMLKWWDELLAKVLKGN